MSGSDATLANVYLQLIPTLDGAQKAIRKEIEPAAEQAGTTAGKKSGKKMALGIGAAMAGAALGKVLSDAWSVGFDGKVANNKVTAALNLTEAESEKVGKAAGALYADAYGESLGEVNEAVGTVMSSISEMSDASQADLEQVTAAALNLQDAFGFDVTEVSNAIGQLVSSGLADSATEGADLLTAAMQRAPEAMRGEILDAANEYGVFLKGFGFDGAEALGVLVAASDGGTIAIDKTVDALKELGIRAKDLGDTNAQEALDQLGFSGEEMANRILAGGDTARGAFNDIITGLQGIEDPAAQSQAALALFGTPLEDLGQTEIPGFLDSIATMDSALGDVGGASGELGDKLYDGTTGFEELKRTMMLVVSEGLEPFIEPASMVADWMAENPVLVKVLVGALAVLAIGLGIASIAVWAMNAALLANPITWIILGVVALIAAIVALAMNWDSIVAWITDVWGGFIDWASGVWEDFTTASAEIWEDFSDKLGEVGQAISDWWNDFWGGIGEFFTGTWDTIKGAGEAAWTWIHDTATGIFDGMRDRIESTFESLKNGLSTIWGGIKAVFAAPINAVIGFINKGIIGGYNWVADKFGMDKLGEIATLPGFASGGWTGAGSKNDLAGFVHADEYVLTKDEVASLGGWRGVQAWLARGLDMHGFADGGLVSYKGHRFTELFAALLQKAEEIAGASMRITQGGWRPATSYSGTSHRGDAVDITGAYSKFIAPLRSLGIPTWDRAGKGNWVDHAHGIPLPGSGTPLGSAIWQGNDYLNGGDGLGGRDNGPRGSWLSNAVAGISGAISAGFSSVTGWLERIIGDITGPLTDLIGGIADGPMADLVKAIGEQLKEDLTAWVKDKLGVGYATGTNYAAPGLAWVGENGPELVKMRGGEQVIPAGMAGRGPLNVNIYNARAETASQSIQRTFAKSAYLGLDALVGGAA